MSLVSEYIIEGKRCLVYCGYDRCNCGASKLRGGNMTGRTQAIEKEVGVNGRFYLQGVLNKLRDHYHQTSVEAGWWSQLQEIEKYLPEELFKVVVKWYLATKLCLMHSEISEMMEGLRKGLADDHLPHRSMEEVEAADVLIRLFDYAGFQKLDLDAATYEKGEYNKIRADHKIVERQGEEGKKF